MHAGISPRDLHEGGAQWSRLRGSGVAHAPSDDKPVGIAKDMVKIQPRFLRVFTGAYRATVARHLETEAAVPPIDHLSRFAAFEALLQSSGKAELLRHAQATVATAIRRHYEARGRGPTPCSTLRLARGRGPTPCSTLRLAQTPGLQQWAAEWMGNDTPAEAGYRAWC
ncbi:MAG: hypothetical protein SEPTF4163_006413 [Sporothrix epigloea]